MRFLLISLFTIQSTFSLGAAEISLWPSGNPGGWSVEGPEEFVEKNDGLTRLKNVSVPTLESFAPRDPPETAAPAMIVCPGGGYSILAMSHEGTDVAKHLAAHGIHAFVLKYRLPRPGTDDVRHAAALQDAQRAISLVRARATEFGVDPARIGMMGFSAGGHLTALVSNTAERTYPPVDAADEISHLPDFIGLIYPAYLTTDADTLTPEIRISEMTPPAFLVHSADDPVTARSSLHYALALQAKKVPIELHIFAEGGHGWGITKAKDKPVASWPALLTRWIKGF